MQGLIVSATNNSNVNFIWIGFHSFYKVKTKSQSFTCFYLKCFFGNEVKLGLIRIESFFYIYYKDDQ